MDDFYDRLAPLYHLIPQDWNASLQRQGEQFQRLIEVEWPGHHTVLDVSCGIGTQAIALAQRGYVVTASDLSAGEIARARREAEQRDLTISFSVCDMRQAHAHHGGGFDVVLSGDNSLPHLLTDADLLTALQQMHACLRDGGACVITMRDYEQEARGRNIFKPYGVRMADGKRYVLSQVWDFDSDGDHYDLSFFVIEEDLATREVRTQVMHSRYYALSTLRMRELMCEAGFTAVRRIDDAFYQPVLVGTKAA